METGTFCQDRSSLETHRQFRKDLHFTLAHHWYRRLVKSNIAKHPRRGGLQGRGLPHFKMAKRRSGFCRQASGSCWHWRDGNPGYSCDCRDCNPIDWYVWPAVVAPAPLTQASISKDGELVETFAKWQDRSLCLSDGSFQAEKVSLESASISRAHLPSSCTVGDS